MFWQTTFLKSVTAVVNSYQKLNEEKRVSCVGHVKPMRTISKADIYCIYKSSLHDVSMVLKILSKSLKERVSLITKLQKFECSR